MFPIYITQAKPEIIYIVWDKPEIIYIAWAKPDIIYIVWVRPEISCTATLHNIMQADKSCHFSSYYRFIGIL